MKKIGLLLLPVVLCLSTCENKDDVPNENLNHPYFTIVDSAFLRFLIDDGVDTNGDGKIDNGEALAVTELLINFSVLCDILDYKISDLSGIEAFTNLEDLFISQCNSKSIDLSKNINLLSLGFCRCALTSLDIANNTALESLYLTDIPLTSTTLDISNNTNLRYLSLVQMFSLEKVCVWVYPLPGGMNDGFSFRCDQASQNVEFTTDCSN